MVSRKPKTEPVNQKRRRPATTPEARENQLVSLAVDLAEQQIRDGSASSQVITHYLKLGSSREQLEQNKLREEVTLLRSKVAAMASAKKVEELYAEALNAMRSYAGQPAQVPRDDDDDDY